MIQNSLVGYLTFNCLSARQLVAFTVLSEKQKGYVALLECKIQAGSQSCNSQYGWDSAFDCAALSEEFHLLKDIIIQRAITNQ